VASVVGTVAFPVGENRMISVGVPLVRPAVAAGVVELVDSGGVTLINGEGTPQAVAANLLEGSSYYIEVVGHRDGSSSTALGHRFEIDEPATKAQSAGKIVLGDSHLNTLEKNSLALIVGHRVVVRPHWTLAGIFGTGTSSPLNSSVNPAEADQVYFSTAKGLSVFYFRGGVSPQWRSLASGPVNQDGAIIPPGVGVFFKRQKNAATFTVVGEVRAGGALIPLFGATDAQGAFAATFAAPIAPITGSPWWSHALTLDAQGAVVATNPFLNLFTQ